MKIAKQRYQSALFCAKKRGIDFLLTFQEWYDWWLSQGVDKNLPVLGGLKRNQFNELCMCRLNDIGPYRLDNIYCATRSQNSRDAHQQDHYVKKILSKRRKPIMTPKGVFGSLTEAANAYGKDIATIGYRRKRYPKDYYYL